MKEIRVRIAPSPTGFAHLGTGYTALFNWAFARKNKGKFVVRVEDSDVKRQVEGAEDAIYDGLEWLGIDWDEGVRGGGPYAPYRISDRLDLYREKSDWLLEKGLAYEEEGAIRFKNQGTDQEWDDLIRGKIHFAGGEVTDFVIVKSDGNPTYNFAVVVDDIEMKITHVIRGEEHISNTPRQLALYQAFGVKPPLFAHHPVLLNTEKKKLSKRRDPVNLKLYQEEGYLPGAMLNYMALLGWSHPEEKEIFPVSEFVESFDISDVRKSSAIFDIKKLDWINGEYIRSLTDAEFVKRLADYIPSKWNSKKVSDIAPYVKSRITKLSEFSEMCEFLFEEPKYEGISLSADDKLQIKAAYEVLEKIDKWSLSEINTSLMEKIESEGFKVGKFFMSLRIAVSGKKVTPPINESIEILGKNETILRLKKVLV